MRLLVRLVLLGVIVLAVIQVIPYGRDHDNPTTVQEIRWDSPETRALAQDTCFACHSNLTKWPWYSSVAPVSWLTTRDVKDGRATLNFSEWQRPQEAELEDVVEAVRGKEMPPLQYWALHSEGRLSASERQQLVLGLVASWTKDPPGR